MAHIWSSVSDLWSPGQLIIPTSKLQASSFNACFNSKDRDIRPSSFKSSRHHGCSCRHHSLRHLCTPWCVKAHSMVHADPLILPNVVFVQVYSLPIGLRTHLPSGGHPSPTPTSGSQPDTTMCSRGVRQALATLLPLRLCSAPRRFFGVWETARRVI